MRTSVLALALGTLAFASASQRLAAQAPANNAAYVELLGSGGVASLNYERRIGAVRARVGYGGWTTSDLFGAGKEEFTTIPITLSHLRGSGRHHLEAGGGVTFGTRTFTSSFGEPATRSSFTTLTGILGYRYQKPGGGFLFRAVFTPFFGLSPEDDGYPNDSYPSSGFTPSAGISLGAAF